MFSYGVCIYCDAQRWLLDDGTVLTELEWCPSWLRWWRTTRHTGRKRDIILDCLARHQAVEAAALTPAPPPVSPGVGCPSAGEGRRRQRQLPIPTTHAA